MAFPAVSLDQADSLSPVLRFLNTKDRDILYLIFVAQKKQKEVQRILKRSQPSLCYDIRRIRRRLKFIIYLLSVFDVLLSFVRHPPEGFDDEMVQVMVLMYYTTSFTQTHEVMTAVEGREIPQIRVRYVYEKGLMMLEEMRLWEFYEMFASIRGNLNIVRRVYKKGRSMALATV